MEYFLIGIITILIAALIFVVQKKRTETTSSRDEGDNETGLVEIDLLEKDLFQRSNIVKVEQLPLTQFIDDKSLFEIKDKKVVARISETIPTAADKIAKTMDNRALDKVELYRAVIPSGATLVDSKQMKGAARGFYRGKNSIKGHANFVKTNPQKISKVSTMANGVANIMSVGSLVVGQYYMTEISSKLESISNSISQISDFQNREFKSRILSLIARVEKISNYSMEILENDELRILKLQTLDDLEGEGTQLLQQVNLTISELINKNHKLDYKTYQVKVDEFSILAEYQRILINLLEEICKLTYLLGKGEISNEMSYSIYNTYLNQSNQTIETLEVWHEEQVGHLGIEIDKNRVMKKGFFATALGVVKEDLKYKELANGLLDKINGQRSENRLVVNSTKNLYDEDVQIIIKDGKYYYLRESTE